MTETGLAVTNLLTDPIETVCAVDGRPLDGAQLRILDDQLAGDMPAGREGNLVVRGPQRHLGFLQQELSETCFTGRDWYITGDRGRFRDDGQFAMTTRAKDIIIRGGENIPVPDVENVLLEHPAVAEVAVVAVPDERLGERACACVVLEPGQDLALGQMRDWFREHRVTTQFWPEYVHIIAALPKTPSGKTRKYALRHEVASVLQETNQARAIPAPAMVDATVEARQAL